MAREAPGDESSEVLFDTRITVTGTSADTFRIFTDGLEGGRSAPDTALEPEPDEEQIMVYTDGSAKNNGAADGQAGAGIFFDENDIRNKAIKVPHLCANAASQECDLQASGAPPRAACSLETILCPAPRFYSRI
jgi:hypothetical protein